MRPPYMLRCPRSLPLSKSYGARPTRAAICLRLMRPSSGSRAMRVKASTGPTPGIEVRRRARSGSAAIISARRFSRRRISASIRARRRLARRRSMASSSWAAWFSTATCSSQSWRLMVTIDAAHREAGGEQGANDAALVAAARLEPDRREGQAAQPRGERAPACLVVADREPCGLRQQQHVEPVLRHVDSTEALLYHTRVPSLLMRARALATVREWKKRLEHQAHSRPCHRGGYGLPVVTGAVS